MARLLPSSNTPTTSWRFAGTFKTGNGLITQIAIECQGQIDAQSILGYSLGAWQTSEVPPWKKNVTVKHIKSW